MADKPFIVFLDIDGVLNNKDTEEKIKDHVGFDKKNIQALNKYLKTLDNYQIILSTSWRLSYSMSQIYKWMKDSGYDGKEFSGKTPKKGGYLHRKEEIQAWLDENEGKYSDFIVLDNINMKSHFGKKQILTYNKDGFKF